MKEYLGREPPRTKAERTVVNPVNTSEVNPVNTTEVNPVNTSGKFGKSGKHDGGKHVRKSGKSGKSRR